MSKVPTVALKILHCREHDTYNVVIGTCRVTGGQCCQLADMEQLLAEEVFVDNVLYNISGEGAPNV